MPVAPTTPTLYCFILNCRPFLQNPNAHLGILLLFPAPYHYLYAAAAAGLQGVNTNLPPHSSHFAAKHEIIKKSGLKTGTKCNIMIHCMSTAQHVNPNVTVPPLFGCGPRNDACRAPPSADVPFHSPQAFGWHKREYTDEIRASVPHGSCCKIQSPPACLNNSIARPTCQRKKEAKQC